MGEDDYIAAISVFAGTYAPVHYALCQGQTFQVQQNMALYVLIGNQFSPNSSYTTFNLPNLANAVPVGLGVGQNGTVQTYGKIGVTAQIAFPDGSGPAISGGAPTPPIVNATQTVGLNYAICVSGIWPSRQ